ncbi:ion channel [Bacillus sp. FJAT-27251]|uniref:ion channel n=1 Tax=Bacillus sp. FJAT-27251 TaxID=1684142 RepID=UPI0006A79FAE|nr:ion channel [Bacillus sp. FJAT-27251]
MSTFLISATIIFIGANLYYFFANESYKKSYFSSVLFLKLFIILLSVTFGFSIIYYILSLDGDILRVGTIDGAPADHSYFNLLYFSGVTILSVGYGDLIPVGGARFFALLEASIGILLPTAYFMKAMSSSDK